MFFSSPFLFQKTYIMWTIKSNQKKFMGPSKSKLFRNTVQKTSHHIECIPYDLYLVVFCCICHFTHFHQGYFTVFGAIIITDTMAIILIALVPVKQPWMVWVNVTHGSHMNYDTTKSKHSTTKPCAYSMGYILDGFLFNNWCNWRASNMAYQWLSTRLQ